MAAAGPHISLIAEPIFSVGGLVITNSILTSVIVSCLLIGFAAWVRASIRYTDKPTGVQNFAEWIVESLYNFVHSITNNHQKTRHFLPFISTFFLFILLNNWIGLLPGVGSIVVPVYQAESHASTQMPNLVATDIYAVEIETPSDHTTEPVSNQAIDEHAGEAASNSEHSEQESESHDVSHAMTPLFRAGTADLNTTIALGIISIFLTQVFGVQYVKLGYFTKFFNFTSPIMFFVGLIELMSEFAKIISFAFRLFGNIFAGEVLLIIISYLSYVVVPMPFYGIEIFVGFIQALVFSMISLVFFNMATESHAH